MSRSAYGMLVNNATALNNLPPFDFLSESARKEFWAEVEKKRRLMKLVEEFNKSFPVEDERPKYPSWLQSSAPDDDPVETLRKDLNATLG